MIQMAYFLSFSVLSVFILVVFLGLQSAKARHNQLLVKSDPYKYWFESQDLSLAKHRTSIKKTTVALVVMFWVAAVVLAGYNEGVAYTLLVVFLGWAPAIALAVAVMALLLGLFQVLRYIGFIVTWVIKANRSAQVVSPEKPD